MSPDTDQWWVGALAMGLAIAHSWLKRGEPLQALFVLEDVLNQFAESPFMDDELKAQLAEYWIGEDDDDDRDVLRQVRV